MSQWYLSKDGKAQGPLDEAAILQKISSGEVNHLDLVFQAGSSEWLPLSEVEVFNEALKKEEEVRAKAKAAEAEAEWIVLKKIKGEKGSKYNQLGPFSKDQVLDLIERGEVKFKDFIWKQGYDSWVTIAQVEEFSEPLPSTPQVDPSLYDEVTQVGEEAEGLSGLVEIEHFEHEKTQVMLESDILLNSSGFATETDLQNPAGFTESQPLVGMVESQESLVDEPIDVTETQTETDGAFTDDTSEEATTDANLWSLKPPETISEIRAPKKSKSEKQKAKKKSKPRTQKKKSSGSQKKWIDQDWVGDIVEGPWPWVAAASILIFSVVMLFMSFSSHKDVALQDLPVEQVEPSVLDTIDPDDFKDIKVEPGADLDDFSVETEALSPVNDPQLAMGSIPQPVAPKRKISSTKKKKAKKTKATVVKRKAKKVKKKISKKAVKPSIIKGTKKEKSFYKQRDRKVIFYSSLKAESLVTEIEQKFKKLRKKKKSWKKFYSGWKKKAKSLPGLVQKYPQRATKYAYPKLISNFKKDHALVLKYGE
ncbi:MAG: DUF4339 domain-containing protein, partial [Bdellovibrionales bacterium]|nr:DUF4339 domain-containing protein [Bdellovibrionales bacterium]NQZ18864.1 DUF4339 domain-containing protein [Bdellovibrionales bacterium]